MKSLFKVVALTVLLHLSQQYIFSQKKQFLELIVETGHTDNVRSIAFSPDGEILASGDSDGVIKLWRTETGQQLSAITGSSVDSLQFSADGKLLAALSKIAKTVSVWNIENGEKVSVYKYGKPESLGFNLITRIDSFVFTPEGNILVGYYDIRGAANVELWEFTPNQKPKMLMLPAKDIFIDSLDFSFNGKILASCEENYTVKFWNTSTGELIENLDGAGYKLEFSPDGKKFATSLENPRRISIWDFDSKKEIERISVSMIHPNFEFSRDGKLLLFGDGKTISSYNLESKEITERFSENYIGNFDYAFFKFSSAKKIFASYGCCDSPFDKKSLSGQTINLWDFESQQKTKSLDGSSLRFNYSQFDETGTLLHLSHYKGISVVWDLISGKILHERSLVLSKSYLIGDGKIVLFDPVLDGSVIRDFTTIEYDLKLLDYNTGNLIHNPERIKNIAELAYSYEGKKLAVGCYDGTIILLDILNWKVLFKLDTQVSDFPKMEDIEFSKDGKILASSAKDGIKIWDVQTGTLIQEIFREEALTKFASYKGLKFSPDGKILAFADWVFQNTIHLWDLELRKPIISFKGEFQTDYLYNLFPIGISSDNKTLATVMIGQSANSLWTDRLINFWDIETGKETKLKEFPQWIKYYGGSSVSKKGSKMLQTVLEGNKIKIVNISDQQELFSLIHTENQSIITTPEGLFDSSSSIDKIKGLHWNIKNESLNPLPLEIFMRQYYEPNLLQRIMRCIEDNTCDKEFKKLPSIADINRVQPKVAIKEIKSSTDVADVVDVTIEVENVAEDVKLNPNSKMRKKKLSSGAFDLRLFRDGQLVGTSANKADLEEYIKSAPQLIEKDKGSKTLINTEEDKAWRKANDIFALKTDNVRFVSPTKAEYTFRNVELPENGSKETVFTAYAFNSDRVKSATTEPFKFTIPEAISKSPKKGRAFLISIGVNASENSAYDLRYAANDARKMQEIVGSKLKADVSKYSEVIQISLISDYGKDESLSENNARKSIIKGVFSILSGNEKEVSGDVLEQIPDYEKLKTIEPEDTLIITFSGHGYTDQTGIFYLLPYDIGTETTRLNSQTLQKTISSDELSLWMQNITASEMIMIIDACYSSAAVQGEGFKPGPMGSRGLGQLAYDKDMKILSATQANNVAIETGRLQHGLLSYALLQDGINKSGADTDKDKKLLSTEWLTFAEKRVPELYQAVKDGKLSLIVDGKPVTGEKGIELAGSNTKKSNLNLQEPRLFDFKRRNINNILFLLP